MVWDTKAPGSEPMELGRQQIGVGAITALHDGRVASGGGDGQVFVWNPAEPSSQPVELGRHDGSVTAVAELYDGCVASGGEDGRVRIWDLATRAEIMQVSHSATALAATQVSGVVSLAIADAGAAISKWSVSTTDGSGS